jgi:hypothetical protein
VGSCPFIVDVHKSRAASQSTIAPRASGGASRLRRRDLRDGTRGARHFGPNARAGFPNTVSPAAAATYPRGRRRHGRAGSHGHRNRSPIGCERGAVRVVRRGSGVVSPAANLQYQAGTAIHQTCRPSRGEHTCGQHEGDTGDTRLMRPQGCSSGPPNQAGAPATRRSGWCARPPRPTPRGGCYAGVDSCSTPHNCGSPLVVYFSITE